MTNPYQPGPTPADPHPDPEAAARRHQAALFVAAGVVLLLVIIAGAVTTLYLNNIGPFKDSGLVMCESIRDAQGTGTPVDIADRPDADPGRLSENEYHRLRSRFADSRYSDIRTAGTQFADLLWQLNGVGRGTNLADALGNLVQVGAPLIRSYRAVSAACANHGIHLRD